MANRNFNRLDALGNKRVLLAGSFQPNGANATVLGVKGNGFTVAHTPGANTYTVTFQDAYFDYDSVSLDAQGGTSLLVQVSTEPDVKVARTLVIAVYSGGGTASNDLAFNANTRVHFQIMLKNTSGNF